MLKCRQNRVTQDRKDRANMRHRTGRTSGQGRHETQNRNDSQDRADMRHRTGQT